jgi:hypothetical protein
MSCGVVLTAERGLLDSIDVSINIRVQRAPWPSGLGVLPDARMSLIDARGAAIPEAPSAQRPSRSLYAFLHGTIGFLYPHAPLGERFRGLPRGNYTLRVEQPLNDGITLRCNPVPLTVSGAPLLGTFKTPAAAEKHERAVQYFKRQG